MKAVNIWVSLEKRRLRLQVHELHWQFHTLPAVSLFPSHSQHVSVSTHVLVINFMKLNRNGCCHVYNLVSVNRKERVWSCKAGKPRDQAPQLGRPPLHRRFLGRDTRSLLGSIKYHIIECVISPSVRKWEMPLNHFWFTACAGLFFLFWPDIEDDLVAFSSKPIYSCVGEFFIFFRSTSLFMNCIVHACWSCTLSRSILEWHKGETLFPAPRPPTQKTAAAVGVWCGVFNKPGVSSASCSKNNFLPKRLNILGVSPL